MPRKSLKMIDEMLVRQIELNNFGAIYAQVIKDNSLNMFCGVVADAVYKEINNPDGDCDFCLSILQVMSIRSTPKVPDFLVPF